jgi:hypothetical protein
MVITTTNAGEDVAKQEPFIHCWWECKLVQTIMKSSMEIPQKN